MTLLNNWENTKFNFNEVILVKLMKEAKYLGVDMFCWMMDGLAINILVRMIVPVWEIGK